MARWLAAGLALLALFQLIPIFRQPTFLSAPEWTRIVVLISAVELAYATWVAFLPDWSTVRVLMLVTASVAAIYALALSLVVFTPGTAPIVLGLGDIRDQARLWCGAVLALTCLLSYICGHASFTWRMKYRKRHAPQGPDRR